MTADLETLHHITFRRALLLLELSNGATEAEAAEALGISRNGIRSAVRDLKMLTGQQSTRALGRWWRESGDEWLTLMATACPGRRPLIA